MHNAIDWSVLAIGVGLVFLLIVQPYVSILDCAVTEQFSKSTKIIWITVLVFTWYLSGVFYGTLATRSRGLRVATWLSVLAVAGGITYLVSHHAIGQLISLPGAATHTVVKKTPKPHRTPPPARNLPRA